MQDGVPGGWFDSEMYNLTVETAHTFFVGEGQWLVHNSDCPSLLGPTAQNTFIHIFGKPQHNLDSLIQQFGGPEAAMRALEYAAYKHFKRYGFEAAENAASGVIKDTVIDVYGISVTIRGRIINGDFRLATAFIPR